jgi:hypothetical protein
MSIHHQIGRLRCQSAAVGHQVVEVEMSVERAKSFLDKWVTDHVHDAICPEDNTDALHLARCCLEAAKCQGLTKADLEAACGEDLVTCMLDAQVAAADAKMSDLIEGAD